MAAETAVGGAVLEEGFCVFPIYVETFGLRMLELELESIGIAIVPGDRGRKVPLYPGLQSIPGQPIAGPVQVVSQHRQPSVSAAVISI